MSEDMTLDIHNADGTILISTVFRKLQVATNELNETCKRWDIKINAQNC